MGGRRSRSTTFGHPGRDSRLAGRKPEEELGEEVKLGEIEDPEVRALAA